MVYAFPFKAIVLLYPLILDLDPIGAIIASVHLSFVIYVLTLIRTQVALGVIVAWTRTVYAQFELLAGKSAPHAFLQLVIYKATTFSDEIEKIDTVRAYHVCHQNFGLWRLINSTFRAALYVGAYPMLSPISNWPL
jgi:hypothetical protein